MVIVSYLVFKYELKKKYLFRKRNKEVKKWERNEHIYVPQLGQFSSFEGTIAKPNFIRFLCSNWKTPLLIIIIIMTYFRN